MFHRIKKGSRRSPVQVFWHYSIFIVTARLDQYELQATSFTKINDGLAVVITNNQDIQKTLEGDIFLRAIESQ